MKWWKHIFSLMMLLVLFACGNDRSSKSGNEQGNNTVNNDLEAGKITVGATEESFDLARRLASTYVSQNTNIIVDVVSLKPSEISESVSGDKVQLVLTAATGEADPEWNTTPVACDLLVLSVSFNNPVLQNLAMRGLSIEELRAVFITGTYSNWNQVDKKSQNVPLKAYLGPAEGSLWRNIGSLLQSSTYAPVVTALLSEGELSDAIAGNPGGIGFISHRQAYNRETRFRAKGLYIIPVDFSNNNLADDAELVFDDLNILTDAYRKGNAPAALVRTHSFVYRTDAGRSDIVKHFTAWAVEKGQSAISSEGYLEPRKK